MPRKMYANNDNSELENYGGLIFFLFLTLSVFPIFFNKNKLL